MPRSVFVRDTLTVEKIKAVCSLPRIEGCSCYVQMTDDGRHKLLFIKERDDGTGEIMAWRYVPEIPPSEDYE